MSLRLLESLATTEPLAEVFSDESLLAAMLRFEVSLARAEADVGIIPPATADAIARATIAGIDAGAIARAARTSGTITIAFVEALTANVRAIDQAAATYVHWGATSQDVSDTALVLCLVRAQEIIEADHARLADELRRLAERHAGTVMLARTLLQPASPTTFGLKAAEWLGAVSRSKAHMSAAFREACVLQFGGASGTLAALGDNGLTVAAGVGRALGLRVPDAPWHAHRDRLAWLVTACGVYTGALGKIARDVSLLMQYEVGEASEPGGGSSAMPHKRNPAGCALALAAATRVPGLVASFLAGMTQEHERGLGGWHAEAPTLASVVQTTGAAAAAIAQVIDTLSINSDRMRENVTATRSLIFAERAMMLLAPALGRDVASRLITAAVGTAAREGQSFVDALAANADVRTALTPEKLASLATPEAYLGVADQLRRRLLGNDTE